MEIAQPLPCEFEHKTVTTDLVIFCARATRSVGGLESGVSETAEKEVGIKSEKTTTKVNVTFPRICLIVVTQDILAAALVSVFLCPVYKY